jgi:hypothetical protein
VPKQPTLATVYLSTGPVIMDAPTFTFMNLLMSVFLGGRERTLDEFAELGRASGLMLQSTSPPSGFIPAHLRRQPFIIVQTAGGGAPSHGG